MTRPVHRFRCSDDNIQSRIEPRCGPDSRKGRQVHRVQTEGSTGICGYERNRGLRLATVKEGTHSTFLLDPFSLFFVSGSSRMQRRRIFVVHAYAFSAEKLANSSRASITLGYRDGTGGFG